MKANSHKELVLISMIMMTLGIGGLLALQTFSPGNYNQITGFAANVGTTVNVTGVPATCDFTVTSGLNLVSFFCVGDFVNVEDVFSNISGLTGVFEYQEGSTDLWKVYTNNLPDYVVNDLSAIDKRNGYWVIVNQTERLFYDGVLPAGTNIILNPGYNLLGYPSNETREITSSLQTINNSYSKVVAFNGLTKTFETYTPGSGGSLTQTEPNRGYWINITAADTWVIT